MFNWLIKLMFGDNLSQFPPAGSGRRGDWDESPHNAKLARTIGKRRSSIIKSADEQTKARYDVMDQHIKKLRNLRDSMRAQKKQDAQTV
jgi:hypothetical protein